MTINRLLTSTALALGLFCLRPAQGAVITQTLGDQDFADGAVATSGVFVVASAGEPSPFDTTNGGDAVANMNVSFTFNYGPIVSPLTSATIQFGLWDGESAESGSQLALFRLNGSILLTALLDTQMEANPGASIQIRVYTVTLPGSAFTSLSGGTAAFELQLQGPGFGVLGPTDFNGGGIDFATITLSTDQAPGIPEPGTALLLSSALLAGFAIRRLRA